VIPEKRASGAKQVRWGLPGLPVPVHLMLPR
jgi:hypothetical protein